MREKPGLYSLHPALLNLIKSVRHRIAFGISQRWSRRSRTDLAISRISALHNFHVANRTTHSTAVWRRRKPPARVSMGLAGAWLRN